MALISSSFGLAQVTPVERVLGTETDPRSFSPLIKARGDVNAVTGGAVRVDRLIVRKLSV